MLAVVILVSDFSDVYIDPKMDRTERCIFEDYSLEQAPLYLNPETDMVKMQFLNPLQKTEDFKPEQFLQIQFYFINSGDPRPEWISTEICSGTTD